MCLFPIKARLNPDGGRPTIDREGDILLPCGSCYECISSRALDWATRARHEMSCHSENSFLTLTYDDAHLPSHTILKDPFQRFLKRLRKKLKKKFRYMASHEYGSQFFRPHHHCIIFGYDPKNQSYLKTTRSGERIFTSPEISNLWTDGFHSIGSANERSAYYIAAYALKGKKHEITLPSGEICDVRDSFDCSKRPGIGLEFFISNYRQIVASGNRIPRYYLKKLEHLDPELFRINQDEAMLNRFSRTSLERLAKFKISDQKLHLSSTEFRKDQIEADAKFLYKNHLKGEIFNPEEDI